MFAQRLKELRLEMGLTQAQLAKEAGLRQSHISSWESGLRMPLPDGLLKLANFFNCSVDYLLGNDENEELSKEVRVLVSKYEKLNELDKVKVIGYIDCLISSN